MDGQETDLVRLYVGRGFRGRVGFGARPALLIIDLIRAFTDPRSPLSCDLEEVIAATRRLLDRA
ncbi:hypothetical protein, partial [Vibrio alginolyticus]|uniref:hypothetical protein n=1 Tax=Vibrio alginolyticus TaxID=663 RepID=UPI001A8CDE41